MKKEIHDSGTKDFDFKGRVCSYCGSKLSKKVMNTSCPSVSPYYVRYVVCILCSIINYGVPKALYPVAKEYVEKSNFSYYHTDSNDPDIKAYYKRSDINRVCEILRFYTGDLKYAS